MKIYEKHQNKETNKHNYTHSHTYIITIEKLYAQKHFGEK